MGKDYKVGLFLGEMGKKSFWQGVFVLSIVLILAGFVYLRSFSGVFGGVYLSPGDSQGGIQFTQTDGCEKECRVDEKGNNVFVRCAASFEDLICGASCKGIVAGEGRLAKSGTTLCGFVDCVCNG